MKSSRIILGQFKTNGTLVVSDPCYVTPHPHLDYDPTETVQDRQIFQPDNIGAEPILVRPGTWNAFVAQSPYSSLPDNPLKLNDHLVVIHSESPKQKDALWTQEFDLFTDSGMMGIFDVETALKSFDYGKMTSMKNSRFFDFGPVVRSGHGDGEFPVYVLRNEASEVEGIMVSFIEDEDDMTIEDT